MTEQNDGLEPRTPVLLLSCDGKFKRRRLNEVI